MSFCTLISPIIAIAMPLAFSTPTQACSSLLNDAITAVVRPLIEASEPCRELGFSVGGGCAVQNPFGGCIVRAPSFGIDKSRVELRDFSYCVGDGQSEVRARVNVRCSTSPEAVIQTHIEEDITLTAVIDDATCALRDFHVEPSGEIGKWIAKAAGATGRLRGPIQSNLDSICR
ncbi:MULTISPECIES: hypothetical protein [Mesorhizobium]|uniref:hypothetical protein n=1 Tax=Mesorhizobium TaxID=68287 RepID=UPI0007FFE4DD|nr:MULTISPECIES: hypothetical protein [Mesorhizobium]MUT27349.1 hypothetical protein [Mesorhizobium japonicum]OBQ82365.1 hypothetical protein A9K71_26355 [Mesorhizobium sp. WSM3873]